MSRDISTFGRHDILLDIKLDQHLHSDANPHKVTKAQVGLGNVDNKSAYEIETETLEKVEPLIAEEIEKQLGEDYATKIYVDDSVSAEQERAKSVEATKQDIISDLDTIRNGAALGSTALQSYTETDPTVPDHVKAITEEDIEKWNKSQPWSKYDLTIKSVNIYDRGSKGFLLEIISNPISEKLKDLIKTTTKVRIKFNGLNKNGRRISHCKFKLRDTLIGLTDEDIENFFTFRAPAVKESDLVENEYGQTYIKYDLFLNQYVIDKIKAINGDSTPEMNFTYSSYKANILPYSGSVYAGGARSDDFLGGMSNWGYQYWWSNTGAWLGYTFKDYTSLLPNKSHSRYSPSGRIYEMEASNILHQVISTGKTYNPFCVFAPRPQWSRHLMDPSGIYTESWASWKQIMERCQFPVNAANPPVVNMLSSYERINSRTYVGGGYCRTGLRTHNSKELTAENIVFSFGILTDDALTTKTHLWEKSFEKYPSVLRIYYHECSRFEWTLDSATGKYVAKFMRGIDFYTKFSLKALPKDSIIWK